MTDTCLWVAIEGPCCAGKTTLARGLVSELSRPGATYVECYADHVGGGRFLPRPVPESLAEDADALRKLLSVEAGRVAASRSHPTELIVLDRSVHTLLAHRYALERVTGLRCYTPAQQALALSDIPAWPDLVLYLDVPQQAVHDRNNGKFPDDSIFIKANFNSAVRSYFGQLADREESRVAWLDATHDVSDLLSAAAAHVRERLHGDAQRR